jgi:hypothetical protein
VRVLVDLNVRLGRSFSSVPGLPLGALDRLLREQYYDQLLVLFRRKPVFRLLFNGPLIISDYTRPTWGLELGSYIKSLIFTSREENNLLLVGDPFAEKADLPLSLISKSKTFFSLVRDIDREAARERMAVMRELEGEDDDD